MKALKDRDFETLAEIEQANISHSTIGHRRGWAKPMDFGGSNGSHHSATATKLARHGLVEVESPSVKHAGRSKYWRAGKLYRITAAGVAALRKRWPDRKPYVPNAA